MARSAIHPLQLLDQGRALHVEEPGRLSLVAAGPLERLLDQFALDARDEVLEVQTVLPAG